MTLARKADFYTLESKNPNFKLGTPNRLFGILEQSAAKVSLIPLMAAFNMLVVMLVALMVLSQGQTSVAIAVFIGGAVVISVAFGGAAVILTLRNRSLAARGAFR